MVFELVTTGTVLVEGEVPYVTPLTLSTVTVALPAEDETSPVRAGSCVVAREPERLLKEGWALEITPSAEMAVRNWLLAPVSGCTATESALGRVKVRAAVGSVT